jgi:hypothetical protein
MLFKDKVKKCFTCILNDKYYTGFMTVITIFALFGDDIRLLGSAKVFSLNFKSLFRRLTQFGTE